MGQRKPGRHRMPIRHRQRHPLSPLPNSRRPIDAAKSKSLRQPKSASLHHTAALKRFAPGCFSSSTMSPMEAVAGGSMRLIEGSRSLIYTAFVASVSVSARPWYASAAINSGVPVDAVYCRKRVRKFSFVPASRFSSVLPAQVLGK
jgi:hypothetical protein